MCAFEFFSSLGGGVGLRFVWKLFDQRLGLYDIFAFTHQKRCLKCVHLLFLLLGILSPLYVSKSHKHNTHSKGRKEKRKEKRKRKSHPNTFSNKRRFMQNAKVSIAGCHLAAKREWHKMEYEGWAVRLRLSQKVEEWPIVFGSKLHSKRCFYSIREKLTLANFYRSFSPQSLFTFILFVCVCVGFWLLVYH